MAASPLRVVFLCICIASSIGLLVVPRRMHLRFHTPTRLSTAAVQFRDYGLPPWLVKSCSELGYVEPIPVQSSVLPVRSRACSNNKKLLVITLCAVFVLIAHTGGQRRRTASPHWQRQDLSLCFTSAIKN
jgi:hypothetical protein